MHRGLVRHGEHAYKRQAFTFMKAFQPEFQVKIMLRVFKVSSSGYYAWLRRDMSAHRLHDILLLAAIRKAHLDSRGTYGVLRVHAELKAQGWRLGKKRVARLMSEAGIAGITRRRYNPTTVRNKKERPAPDLVDRKFQASGPNKLWVADITEIPTVAGKLYLATVLDVWSRRVVGFAMDTHMESTLAQRALTEALRARETSSVIHHSDQGSQYTAGDFKALAKDSGVDLSMGSVGDCYDDAMAESFFATLECELLALRSFADPDEARVAVFEFIAAFYNTARRHSAIDYFVPAEFEELHADHLKKAA
jgi:putative transposase